MNATEQSRFDLLYQHHLTALNLQGKARKTIEAYAFAIRRLARHVDRCPDNLTPDELRDYFVALIKSHSWSAVKIDRNGIRFFHEHVLKAPLPWIDMVKPPRIQSLPDVLAREEIARLIGRTHATRYQTFWLVTYSMGLRLGEALNLTVADIDSSRMLVHIRQGKGNKDRFVILPALTLQVLRREWCRHRHPHLLFPGKAAPGGGPAPGVMDRAPRSGPLPRWCAIAAFAKRSPSTACATATPRTWSRSG
jgi:integrase/recombinase XerD